MNLEKQIRETVREGVIDADDPELAASAIALGVLLLHRAYTGNEASERLLNAAIAWAREEIERLKEERDGNGQ